jgi:hypothetical protein
MQKNAGFFEIFRSIWSPLGGPNLDRKQRFSDAAATAPVRVPGSQSGIIESVFGAWFQ